MHKVERYHCDFCRKTLANRKEMETHENNCFYNPASHSCGTCAHLCLGVQHGVIVNKMEARCRLGMLDPDNCTKRNPSGMRKNCEHHQTDPYRFDKA